MRCDVTINKNNSMIVSFNPRTYMRCDKATVENMQKTFVSIHAPT